MKLVDFIKSTYHCDQNSVNYYISKMFTSLTAVMWDKYFDKNDSQYILTQIADSTEGGVGRCPDCGSPAFAVNVNIQGRRSLVCLCSNPKCNLAEF
jgi:hypothetical protein